MTLSSSHSPVYLSSMGMVCALGNSHQQILNNLLAGSREGMVPDQQLIPGKELRLGRVTGKLAECNTDCSSEQSRNNQLLLTALTPVHPEVSRLIDTFGSDRIGIILGTSTSGTLEAEVAMGHYLNNHHYPAGYDFRIQEMGDPSRFLARYLSITGPAYTVSTACSSSGKVFASARNLIRSGICDAVIAGGVDSLCGLTIHGFSSLESVADGYCQPFSDNRNGINLGEGAALFTITREPATIQLLGVGESSDAWHISAPHPEGTGAETAMQAALADADLTTGDIHYLNLHGTATPLNDAMESQAVIRLFGADTPCSSTKTMTGHTLGAAGAIEAGLSWLLLSDLNQQQKLPPHIADQPRDETLAPINLVSDNATLPSQNPRIMSNSFAFGGSNVSVILGKQL
ncbi:beta-ketoacyl-[acyl-carrier-protein] synthase family protein [Endozoicomonas sp.]|uniref:beta-ketoacyl-[acyl-carrier-protein] synthase family protein n=1 Tax=Endozoicomonas sp. TaxID=1892382 RepID=UPI002887D6B0|nr:beta-ketoacyl-[acyl-carrier-protein] synthase family protein [Endozoicomonas sp.]